MTSWAMQMVEPKVTSGSPNKDSNWIIEIPTTRCVGLANRGSEPFAVLAWTSVALRPGDSSTLCWKFFTTHIPGSTTHNQALALSLVGIFISSQKGHGGRSLQRTPSRDNI